MTTNNELPGAALAVVEARPLTVPDIRDVEHDLDAVEAFKRAVHQRMIDGVDYGTIPGTPKPTLYQPGAQKVCELMKLRPRFEPARIVEDFDRPLFHYAYRCVLVHIPSGYEVSECIGSCNSMESKYRWRYSDKRCPSCGEETIRKSNPQYGDGWYCNRKAGGCGASFGRDDHAIANQAAGKVPNDDIFSQLNTLDKMAQKRGLVGSALFIGRLSDVFTQDLEDMDIRHIPADERTVDAPPAEPPAQNRRNGNQQASGGEPQTPRGRVTGRCQQHDKPWGRGPEDRVGHPEGDGWCWQEQSADASEGPTAKSSLVRRLGEKLRSEGVFWPGFLKFLSVDTWEEYEQRFGGEGIADREREKTATKAAWASYDVDKKYRAGGCKKCGGEANALGQLWCQSCIDADNAANAEGSDDQPMFDAEGKELNPPMASEAASPDEELPY